METQAIRDDGLSRAIELLGGYAPTARALGIKTAWGVQKWKTCPAERVKDLVAATGGKITAHDLRPDLYPVGFVFPPEMLASADGGPPTEKRPGPGDGEGARPKSQDSVAGLPASGVAGAEREAA